MTEAVNESGGTAIYVRDNIPCKHRMDLIVKNSETSWIEVNRPKSNELFIGCVYRHLKSVLRHSLTH